MTAALEPSSLVQNFSHCLNHAGVRAKHIMLDKLTTIVPEVRPPCPLRFFIARHPVITFSVFVLCMRDVKESTSVVFSMCTLPPPRESVVRQRAAEGSIAFRSTSRVSQWPHPSPSSRRTRTLSSGERVSRVYQVYQVRPNLITKYVLPASFSLLTETKGEIRAANAQLLMALWRVMGSALNEHAASLSLPSQQRLSSVLAAAM